MAKYAVAPTKTNLIKNKRGLSFAQEGYELLEQKREILVAELMSIMDQAAEAQHTMDETLKEAYEFLQQAVVGMGRRAVSLAALSTTIRSRIDISSRKIMGVSVPVVTTSHEGRLPSYGVGGTTFWLDETILEFRKVLELMGKLVQTRLSVLRLSKEVNKTIRRVNALEKIYIPDYEETIKYIADVLDEMDREAFFILKLIKTRLEKKKEAQSDGAR